MYKIKCPLMAAARISKDEAGLACSDGTLRYYEYDQVVTTAAQGLVAAGIRPGDYVVHHVRDGWRSPVLLLAILRAGAVARPVPPDSTEEEVFAAVREVHAAAVVTSSSLPAKTGDSFLVLRADDIALMGQVDDRRAFADPIDAARPASVVWENGQNGARAAIVHSYANHYYSAMSCNSHFDLRSHDRWLLTRPLHETEGIAVLFRCMLSGATLALPDAGESVADAVQRLGATHVTLAANEVADVLSSMPKRGGKLKCVAVPECVSPDLIRSAGEVRVSVFGGFALPEMSSFVSAGRRDTPMARRCTAGLPLRHAEMKIGPEGRVLVRGHMLFSGYLAGGEISKDVDAEGWFDTGVNGQIDSDGLVVLQG